MGKPFKDTPQDDDTTKKTNDKNQRELKPPPINKE